VEYWKWKFFFNKMNIYQTLNTTSIGNFMYKSILCTHMPTGMVHIMIRNLETIPNIQQYFCYLQLQSYYSFSLGIQALTRVLNMTSISDATLLSPLYKCLYWNCRSQFVHSHFAEPSYFCTYTLHQPHCSTVSPTTTTTLYFSHWSVLLYTGYNMLQKQ
jgi:hypothetical protein